MFASFRKPHYVSKYVPFTPFRRFMSGGDKPLSRFPAYFDPKLSNRKKTAAEAVNNILYNTPLITQSSSRRVLSCLVTDEPGVLSRVSGILAGRGFNIDSLVVSSTDVTDLSRMTIVLNAPESTVEQARRQLEDLVPVWAVLDYSDVSIIERELLLIKVSLLPQDRPISTPSSLPSHLFAPDFQRQALTELTRLFGGRVVDVTVENMILELSAKPSRIEAFIQLCRPYGVLEAARSGMMAIPRSAVNPYGDASSPQEKAAPSVDATLLPPG